MGIRLASPNKLRLRGAGKLALTGTGGSAPPTGTPATAISVSEVGLDGKIFQRSGTSKLVPVSFTSNGSNLDARVIHARSGAVILDWTPLVTGHPGGAGTANLLVPQCQMGTLQIRDGINTALTASCALRFAVGVVVATLGQSNMFHLYDSPSLYPLASQDTRNYYAAGNVWEFVSNHDDTNTYPPNTPFSTYGATRTDGRIKGDGIVYFVNNLAASLGCAVGVLDYAVSGSAIASWQPGSGGNWTTFSNALTASGNDCEVALWYQGEENANAGTSSASWQASLANIMNGIRTQTGRTAANSHFGVVTLGPTVSYGAEGSFGTMRAAALAFVASNAGVFLAGVATDGDVTDGVHLSAAMQGRLGKRYAKSTYARLIGADKPGPKIGGATRSGTTVTVVVTGGTGALKDGAGGSGAALLGFRFFDAGAGGAQIAYTASTISGSTVLLTLASAPAGALTMDYAMANTPYGSASAPVPAAILYDSDTVPGDTLGLPLQPCMAIVVS
jgi:hypothetical protein